MVILSATPADISESLARLNVFAVREGQTTSQSDRAGETEGGKKSPPPHGPNGILNDFILESISFKSMRNREEEVADAHGSTFDWIFNPKGGDAKNNLGDHYMKWLGGDEMGSIYWGMQFVRVAVVNGFFANGWQLLENLDRESQP